LNQSAIFKFIFDIFFDLLVNSTASPFWRIFTSDVASRGEHGQDQDWISCRILVIFWITIGVGYLFLKKNGSGQDQDICLISIMKFPRESDSRCHK